eukprot:tig00021621_g22990.t1
MAGFAKLNERTLREFLTALTSAFSLWTAPCRRSSWTIYSSSMRDARLPYRAAAQVMVAPEAPETKRPRVRKMAVAADDADELTRPSRRNRCTPPWHQGAAGAPVSSRRHPDEEN